MNQEDLILTLMRCREDFLSAGLVAVGGTFPESALKRARAKVGRPIWDLRGVKDWGKKVQRSHGARRGVKDLFRTFRERGPQGIAGLAGMGGQGQR